MFCDFSYRQDKGALEGLEKDRETIFQRIRQRQGREKNRHYAYIQQEEEDNKINDTFH